MDGDRLSPFTISQSLATLIHGVCPSYVSAGAASEVVGPTAPDQAVGAQRRRRAASFPRSRRPCRCLPSHRACLPSASLAGCRFEPPDDRRHALAQLRQRLTRPTMKTDRMRMRTTAWTTMTGSRVVVHTRECVAEIREGGDAPARKNIPAVLGGFGRCVGTEDAGPIERRQLWRGFGSSGAAPESNRPSRGLTTARVLKTRWATGPMPLRAESARPHLCGPSQCRGFPTARARSEGGARGSRAWVAGAWLPLQTLRLFLGSRCVLELVVAPVAGTFSSGLRGVLFRNPDRFCVAVRSLRETSGSLWPESSAVRLASAAVWLVVIRDTAEPVTVGEAIDDLSRDGTSRPSRRFPRVSTSTRRPASRRMR